MESLKQRFKTIEKLNIGAAATCYKANQLSLDRLVILKILHPQFSQDIEIIKRFEREAKIMSRLDHKNIVKIIDFGKTGDSYFIVMEYVKGNSLVKLIKDTPLSYEDAINIGIQLADAVAYAHSKGIIHRDIKPSNIIVKNNTPKLTDFGLAQFRELLSLTIDGALIGTPSYMSFEQAQGKKVGPQTDIYSLGLVILEMITGKKAFPGETLSEVLKCVLTKEPEGVNILDERAHGKIPSIVKKMIAKEISVRYSTMQEVLSDFYSETGSKKSIPKPFGLEPFRAKPKSRRSSVKIVSSIIGLIVMGVLIYLFVAPIRLLNRNKELSIAPQITETSKENIKPKTTTVLPNAKLSSVPLRGEGRGEPTIAEVSIIVTPYARIYIDGKDHGETPLKGKVALKSGKHTIKLVNPYLPEIEKEIEVDGRSEILVDLFKEISYLMLTVTPWAEVYIDKKMVSSTPISDAIKLKPGTHNLRIHNPYFKDVERTIEFKKGDTVFLNIKLEK